MNKASFLTLVRQASRISDQDVEELEKLVVNFPYCQTAHLLIAKAAYDKGSMLSNQKLKKAAIYAANRQLLKKLIYTSDATVSLQPLENIETVAEKPEKLTSSQVSSRLPEVEILEETETHQVDLDADITGIESVPEQITASELKESVAGENHAVEDSEFAEEEIEAEKSQAVTNIFLEKPTAPAPALGLSSAINEDAFIAEEILEETSLPGQENPEKLKEAETDQESGYPELSTAEPSEFTEFPQKTNEEDETSVEITEEKTLAEKEEKVQELVAKTALILNDIPDVHELFLENAPEAIQEISEQKQESEDIAVQTETATTLNDDLLHETLANFDQYLFRPEKQQETGEEEGEESAEELKVIYPENEIQHIYDNDPLGYWMSSSRLGESLQLKNDLTSPQPYDFYPELIWEYSKTHELRKEIKPAASKLTKQLEIIDEFLKMTPRLKTMAQNKVKPTAQEDLSSKSSKINKNLASENFANILVQQGKIKKAIKIYEHLILKIPEKKPYFVAQIEKLQNME